MISFLEPHVHTTQSVIHVCAADRAAGLVTHLCPSGVQPTLTRYSIHGNNSARLQDMCNVQWLICK